MSNFVGIALMIHNFLNFLHDKILHPIYGDDDEEVYEVIKTPKDNKKNKSKKKRG